MQPFSRKPIGTMILVLLGDGVVANVVLDRTKGQNSGWIVITDGLGHRRGDRRLRRRPHQRRAPQPRRDDRARDDRQLPVGATCPATSRAQMVGAFARRGARLAGLPAALARHRGSGREAGGLLHRARRSAAPAANCITEIIGTAVLLFGILAIAANAQTLSKPGDVDLSFVFSRGLQPLLVGVLVLGIGLSLGGPTGYAINPARDLGPRIAHAVLPIPGKGSSDWAYSWIPVVAPDHRRHRRRRSLLASIGF